MSRTLTDISSEMKAQNVETSSREAHSIVSDVSVRMPYLYIQTLCGEEVKVGSISELINNDAREFVMDNIDDKYHIPQEIISDICQLQSSLIYSWDRDAEKYRVEVRMDNNGNISELYVPTESKITEDITVSNMSDGDEVFQNIKKRLRGKMYKIETMELRVDEDILEMSKDYKIDTDIPVYQKKQKFFNELYKKASEENRDIKDDVKAIGILSTFILSVTSIFMYVTSLSSASDALLLASGIGMLFSSIIWMVASVLIMDVFSNAIEAKFFDSNFTCKKITTASR
jgi:hypothetical protein